MPSASTVPRIAIIGAGSSGLAAARVFARNGVEPIVLEKDDYSGGVWNYHEDSKTRPIYRGLRTNLPKEIMQFREFPFPQKNSQEDDPSFLSHDKVLEYLDSYQRHFGITKYIRYGCEVSKLEILQDDKSSVSPSTERWPQIRLEWNEHNTNDPESSTTKTEIFDACLVCNGHYSKPSYAKIPGLKEHFKGRIMHSIEYDNPADYQDLTVLCVGGRASGSDLAREIAPFTKRVYMSDSTCQLQPGQEPEQHGNIIGVPLTVEVQADGSVRFENCTTVSPTVDCIIFCTGYDYHFPFLTDPNIVQCNPGERRVMPLYEQLWHARYPTLSFVGIPHSVVPFPEVELQAEAVHAQYCVKNLLPPSEERIEVAEEAANSGGAKENGRIQDTHYLGGAQWDYCRKMAKLAGLFNEAVDNYIAVNQMIYEHSWVGRKEHFAAGPDTYREIDYRRNDAERTFTFHPRSEKS